MGRIFDFIGTSSRVIPILSPWLQLEHLVQFNYDDTSVIVNPIQCNVVTVFLSFVVFHDVDVL